MATGGIENGVLTWDSSYDGGSPITSYTLTVSSTGGSVTYSPPRARAAPTLLLSAALPFRDSHPVLPTTSSSRASTAREQGPTPLFPFRSSQAPIPGPSIRVEQIPVAARQHLPAPLSRPSQKLSPAPRQGTRSTSMPEPTPCRRVSPSPRTSPLSGRTRLLPLWMATV